VLYHAFGDEGILFKGRESVYSEARSLRVTASSSLPISLILPPALQLGLVMRPQYAGLGLWRLGAPSATDPASAVATAPVVCAAPPSAPLVPIPPLRSPCPSCILLLYPPLVTCSSGAPAAVDNPLGSITLPAAAAPTSAASAIPCAGLSMINRALFSSPIRFPIFVLVELVWDNAGKRTGSSNHEKNT